MICYINGQLILQLEQQDGSYAHLLLENLENRILDKPEVIIPAGLDTFQTINYAKSINIVNKLCEQYLDEYNYLTPIAIEYKVGDVEMGIAGTLDRLYFNELTNAIEVWDFKNTFSNIDSYFEDPDHVSPEGANVLLDSLSRRARQKSRQYYAK